MPRLYGVRRCVARKCLKMYQPIMTEIIKGTTATKNHLILGFPEKVSTPIEKKPTVKVSGEKIKVIQLSPHELRIKVRG